MQTLSPTPRAGLSSLAYQHLRYHLSIGSFAPGQRLKLRDLAASMAMSLTPVREALGQLVTEGVLMQADHRSVRVPLLGAATYLEIAHVRCVLEGLAAEAAAKLATTEEIDDMAAIHQRIVESKRRDDYTGTVLGNRDFHLAACRLARMPVLARLVDNLWLMSGPVITTMGKGPIGYRPSRHPHKRYIEGLRQRDGTAAREAIDDDIRGNAKVYASFLPVHGDEVSMPQLLQPILGRAATPDPPPAARTTKA
jgi:DNA-binding GntR family transcriptional regulator